MSGSWRWRSGWTWDTTADTLVILDSKDDNGITVALNASSTEYESCSVESLYYMAEGKKWTEESELFSHSKPVMFKLNKMWHLSWVNDLTI